LSPIFNVFLKAIVDVMIEEIDLKIYVYTIGKGLQIGFTELQLTQNHIKFEYSATDYKYYQDIY
jgi:hypothetical protein